MSTNNQHIDEVLLTGFLRDEITPDERQKVLQWLAESEANQDYFDSIEQVWLESEKLDPVPITVDTDAAWNKLQMRIQAAEAPALKAKKVAMGSSRTMWMVAASLVLLAALYFVFSYRPSADPIILANNSTENLLQTLPDGSDITLSEGAQLAYTESFNQDERRVSLQGKAFFDIERDTTKTFTIDAGIGGVQVLGTSFSVDVEHDSDIVVDVVSGVVRLFLPQESGDTLVMVLHKGESGIISNKLKTIEKIDAEPEALYWIDKTLVFRNTNMDKVINVLEEVYKVSVFTQDSSILSLPISVRFENAQLVEILEVVSLTLNIDFEQKGANVYLRTKADD